MSPGDICQVIEADTAVVATAIHAGHAMRDSLLPYVCLSDKERLREEDPFTDIFASAAKSRILATKSRFQVDLNRPRERAVYKVPKDAWGLKIWRVPLPQEEIDRSLREYDSFYRSLKSILEAKIERYGQVIILDIHSYNHRRLGEKAPFDDPMQNPEIIIGTGTMTERNRWKRTIAALTDILQNRLIMGRYLDVRENIKFQGGYMAQWIHRHYPEAACCLSLEFQKIFMNEWTGVEDSAAIHEIKEMIGNISNFLETI